MRKQRAAEYGKLTVASGTGFSEKNQRHMMRFFEAFPDSQIVSSLMRQLSWSHYLRGDHEECLSDGG